MENEHPALRAFKQEAYGGSSYATEYCRAGFAVIVTDAFYWGERRLVTDQDVEKGINDPSKNESPEMVQQVNL